MRQNNIPGLGAAKVTNKDTYEGMSGGGRLPGAGLPGTEGAPPPGLPPTGGAGLEEGAEGAWRPEGAGGGGRDPRLLLGGAGFLLLAGEVWG